MGKYAPRELKAPYCVSWNVQDLCSIYVRFGHNRERFASTIVTQNMLPPYSVLRPSGVKMTKDIKKGESTICKLATTENIINVNFDPNIPLDMLPDASRTTVGAVLQQLIGCHMQLLSFFSKQLESAQTRCSAFGRENLAFYLAFPDFLYILNGRTFIIFTDHKSLIFALYAKPDKHS